MRLNAQSAIEFLTTYSWALLIVTVFVAVVFTISFGGGAQQYYPSSCNIQPLLPCLDSELLLPTPVTYYVAFINNLQSSIYMPAGAFNAITTGIGVSGTKYTLGNCYPQLAVPGDRVVCVASIPGTTVPYYGTKVNTNFAITYKICNSNLQSSCGSSLYQTSGTGTQTLATANVPFYGVNALAQIRSSVNSVQLSCSAANPGNACAGGGGFGSSKSSGISNVLANAIIVINGAPYSTGQQLLLSPGNYIVGARVPAIFYLFQQWSSNVPTSSTTVTPANTLSANLVLTAPANILMNFSQSISYETSLQAWSTSGVDGSFSTCAEPPVGNFGFGSTPTNTITLSNGIYNTVLCALSTGGIYDPTGSVSILSTSWTPDAVSNGNAIAASSLGHQSNLNSCIAVQSNVCQFTYGAVGVNRNTYSLLASGSMTSSPQKIFYNVTQPGTFSVIMATGFGSSSTPTFVLPSGCAQVSGSPALSQNAVTAIAVCTSQGVGVYNVIITNKLQYLANTPMLYGIYGFP